MVIASSWTKFLSTDITVISMDPYLKRFDGDQCSILISLKIYDDMISEKYELSYIRSRGCFVNQRK